MQLVRGAKINLFHESCQPHGVCSAVWAKISLKVLKFEIKYLAKLIAGGNDFKMGLFTRDEMNSYF